MPYCADQFPRPELTVTVLAVLMLSVAGCAGQPYKPTEIASAQFLERGVAQTQEPLRVTAAVPDAQETEAFFGLPLYDQGIQPIWLEVENRGPKPVRVAIWSIDPDYYSPLEVAWMNRGGYDDEGQATMERWFYENAMDRRIPPGETRSGFVYTALITGTKGFNVDVYANDRDFHFTFFIPIPGFTADYMEVDFQSLYQEAEIQMLDANGLRAVLEKMPCCSTDETGTKLGDPFNVVLVGTGMAVRRAMLRAGWQETAANSPQTVVARSHRYRDRRPDGTFQKSRPDGSEHKELRLWLAPMRVGEDLVWIGQISYELSGTSGEGDVAGYRIDPDIDDAMLYLMQNFWYSQSLTQAAFTKGVGAATIGAPRENFSGATYFTDGLRAVLWVSEEPVGLDEVQVLPWERLIPH